MKKIKIIVADQHPLMLTGIKAYLCQNPSVYRLSGVYCDLEQAIDKCNEVGANILLLGEFACLLSGAELIRWVYSRLRETKIIAYLENSPFLDAETLLSAGVSGCIWKTSPENHLDKGISTVCNGYYFFDQNSLDLQSIGHEALSRRNLTHRETQVLQLIVHGLTNKEIAKRLILSNKTIETHRLNLMKKLEVHNSVELIKAALKMGACNI